MRTVLAPGPRTSTSRGIKLLTQNCARGARVMFAEIRPAPAEGAFPAGTVDASGFGLHLEYTTQTEDAVPHIDYPGVVELDSSRELSVEFGPGTHWLNHDGEVYLVGGLGLWLCDIQFVAVSAPFAHWHTLLRTVAEGQPFTPPHGHSMIGSYNAASTMHMSDDAGATQYQCLVGAVPVPVFGTVTVFNTGSADRRLWVFTQYFG